MHELSIALNILDIAAEASERHGRAQVHVIHIRLGPLSGVVPQALESAFEIARQTSPFPAAVLQIVEVPIEIDCIRCQSTQPVASMQMMRCSRCGTPSNNLVRGNELEITAMEIDDVVAATCT